ncbi:MAG: transposase family protein [Woronichinia naegeliana WA131]|uniref:Transposase family protein n=1 Tax=Woronichinia naegeliana WA131 TaxID=2824559 RepID=A0A977L1W8_9CYAN|nr:MAG: transposase family protein [Woronichinia naegeliana WA131]
MKLRPKYRLVEHFAEIDDPRIERTKRHKLIDDVINLWIDPLNRSHFAH